MIRSTRLLTATLLLVLGPLAGGETAADERAAAALKAKIDPLVEPWLREGYVTGLVVGVAERGGDHVFGYGRVSADAQGRPGPVTLYEIGSITKVFTSLLLATLVEDGAVKLDDPVRTLLPEGTAVPKRGAREITLLDLSTHTSGLPRMPSNFKPGDPTDPYVDYAPKDLYAFLKKHELERAPGEAWAYSNLGAGLLGHALARKAGKDYEVLLRERILEPLGMRDTGISLDEARSKRLAPPYGENGSPNHVWKFDALAGAGAIRSTMADMLKFARANMQDADTPLGRALALTHETRFGKPGESTVMGLGWIKDAGGSLWHNGQTGGYSSILLIDAERRFAVCVLCNTSSATPQTVGRTVARMLAGLPVEPPKPEKKVRVDGTLLEAYAGRYELAIQPGFVLTVTREGEGLAVQASGQPKLAVYAKSDDTFAYRAVKAEITFERDADGTVTGLVLHQHGRDMKAKRLAK